jgi:VIT1/CCC1 family predicted Fe2+/Mn2+ transporter
LRPLRRVLATAIVRQSDRCALASERRSDRPRQPGSARCITGGRTFFGGVFHTLPFLISNYHAAIAVAIVIVAVELVFLAWLRYRFFRTSFLRSFVSVTVGGAIIASLSAALGVAAAG